MLSLITLFEHISSSPLTFVFYLLFCLFNSVISDCSSKHCLSFSSFCINSHMWNYELFFSHSLSEIWLQLRGICQVQSSLSASSASTHQDPLHLFSAKNYKTEDSVPGNFCIMIIIQMYASSKSI